MSLSVSSTAREPSYSGAQTLVTTFTESFDPRIDGLLAYHKWYGNRITYGDPSDASDYQSDYPRPLDGVSHISAAQLRVARIALDADHFDQPAGAAGLSVEGFTNLRIEYSGAKPGAATIRFANTDEDTTAYAYPPNYDDLAGDAFFGGSGRDPVTGNYDYQTILHELGHTLGLKHGHENVDHGAVPGRLDSLEFSVMTYRSYVHGPTDGYTNEQFGYPQTYMMLDIAALQYLYGADFSTNSDATVYRWSPSSGQMTVNGADALTPGGNRVFSTIWDGGGVDTYDLSAYGTDMSISLAPGGRSTFSATQLAYLGGGPNDGYARGNLFNALQYRDDPRSLIENALGGAGDDTITGNVARNRLVGGPGDDRLNGGAGHDTLVGGDDSDRLRGGAGNDRLEGGHGADRLIGGAGADRFVFTSSEWSAPGRSDILVAGDGGDALDGPGRERGDRIDLRGIDANSDRAGDQAFVLGDGKGAGRLWLVNDGSVTHIYGNTDRDAAPEFDIRIADGGVRASAYTVDDFYL